MDFPNLVGMEDVAGHTCPGGECWGKRRTLPRPQDAAALKLIGMGNFPGVLSISGIPPLLDSLSLKEGTRGITLASGSA
jgi:hypothetical protein